MGHDRRPGHAEADHAHVRRRLGACELLERDRLVRVRGAAAAVLLRPGQPGVAGVVHLAAPLAPVAGRQVRLEPGADALAEGGLLRAVAQLHGTTLTRIASRCGRARPLARGAAGHASGTTRARSRRTSTRPRSSRVRAFGETVAQRGRSGGLRLRGERAADPRRHADRVRPGVPPGRAARSGRPACSTTESAWEQAAHALPAHACGRGRARLPGRLHRRPDPRAPPRGFRRAARALPAAAARARLRALPPRRAVPDRDPGRLGRRRQHDRGGARRRRLAAARREVVLLGRRRRPVRRDGAAARRAGRARAGSAASSSRGSSTASRTASRSSGSRTRSARARSRRASSRSTARSPTRSARSRTASASPPASC